MPVRIASWSVSPNSCVIENDKPIFMPITDILLETGGRNGGLVVVGVEDQAGRVGDRIGNIHLWKRYLLKNVFTRIKNSRRASRLIRWWFTCGNAWNRSCQN